MINFKVGDTVKFLRYQPHDVCELHSKKGGCILTVKSSGRTGLICDCDVITAADCSRFRFPVKEGIIECVSEGTDNVYTTSLKCGVPYDDKERGFKVGDCIKVLCGYGLSGTKKEEELAAGVTVYKVLTSRGECYIRGCDAAPEDYRTDERYWYGTVLERIEGRAVGPYDRTNRPKDLLKDCVSFLVPNKDGTGLVDLMDGNVWKQKSGTVFQYGSCVKVAGRDVDAAVAAADIYSAPLVVNCIREYDINPEIDRSATVVIRDEHNIELNEKIATVIRRDETHADLRVYISGHIIQDVWNFPIYKLELAPDSALPLITSISTIDWNWQIEQVPASYDGISIDELDFETITTPNPDCPICNGKGHYWSKHSPLIHEFLGGVPYPCNCSMEKVICKQSPDHPVVIEPVIGTDDIHLTIGKRVYVLNDEEQRKHTVDFFRTWNLKDGLRSLDCVVKD